MNNVSWFRSVCVALSLLLAACGGGGGSGPAPVSYSGATTQATVTGSNARALSVDAFQGGQAGSTIGIMGVVTQSGTTAGTAARLQALGRTLEGAVARLVPVPASAGSATAAGASAQATIPGPYGGSMTYAISYNEMTGAFSGTITFNAFKGDPNGAAVSGSVTFSGAFDLASQTFSSLQIGFTSLTVTEGGVTFIASGSVSVNVGTGTETTSMSLVLQNSATGKTYWVKDYTYTYSSGGGTLTLSGTYYDHDYGYVTVTTVTPLQVMSSDAWPTAGVLMFAGANGTRARLTFTTTGYTVEVDTGNGVFAIVP